MDDEYVPSDQLRIKKGTLFLVVLVTSVVCVIGGVMGHDLFSEPVVVMPAPEVIKEELTESELRMLAEDLIKTEAERADDAMARVDILQKELAAKEAELAKVAERKAAAAERKAAVAEKEARASAEGAQQQVRAAIEAGELKGLSVPEWELLISSASSA